MSAIRENIVGLFRFNALLASVFFLQKRKDQRERKLEKDEHDKYLPVLGPTVPLVPAETKFCPKCHLAACQLRRTKEGIQIIQGGRVRVTIGANVTVESGGKEMKGFPVQCPNGHTVRIE